MLESQLVLFNNGLETDDHRVLQSGAKKMMVRNEI